MADLPIRIAWKLPRCELSYRSQLLDLGKFILVPPPIRFTPAYSVDKKSEPVAVGRESGTLHTMNSPHWIDNHVSLEQ